MRVCICLNFPAQAKMTLQELPELLTIKQASLFLNVHPNTLRNWDKQGRLKSVRIGARGDRRFAKSSILNIYQPELTYLQPQLAA